MKNILTLCYVQGRDQVLVLFSCFLSLFFPRVWLHVCFYLCRLCVPSDTQLTNHHQRILIKWAQLHFLLCLCCSVLHCMNKLVMNIRKLPIHVYKKACSGKWRTIGGLCYCLFLCDFTKGKYHTCRHVTHMEAYKHTNMSKITHKRINSTYFKTYML